MPLSDQDALAAQIGRPPRAPARVVRRCDLGLPIVTEVPPVLPSGEPFPTRWWLACPLAVLRVSRLEAAGGVREFERRAESDPALAAALEAAHARYRRERDRRVPPDAAPRPSGGVGGAARGVKCLHAHLAHQWAGGDNPIGREVADAVGPLSCERACVESGPEGPRRSPSWREPSS